MIFNYDGDDVWYRGKVVHYYPTSNWKIHFDDGDKKNFKYDKKTRHFWRKSVNQGISTFFAQSAAHEKL